MYSHYSLTASSREFALLNTGYRCIKGIRAIWECFSDERNLCVWWRLSMEKCWFIFTVFNSFLTLPIFNQRITSNKKLNNRTNNKTNLKLPSELPMSIPKSHIHPHIHIRDILRTLQMVPKRENVFLKKHKFLKQYEAYSTAAFKNRNLLKNACGSSENYKVTSWKALMHRLRIRQIWELHLRDLV